MSLSALLKQRALEIGFDLVGIAPLAAWKDLEFSRQWVEQGFGGEMRYLANPKRDDPRRLLPSVKSIICVGLVYDTEHPYSTEAEKAEGRGQKALGSGRKAASGGEKSAGAGAAKPTRVSDFESRVSSPATGEEVDACGPRAWVSRYAWGQDYHQVLRARLERLRTAVEELVPGAETQVYVDTGPIVERAFARYSGIGWMGKNTCLINERQGSWFFLGVLLSSLGLAPDLPAPDRCGSCTRCLEACPTGALVEPYVMDASRCISYFTIELKGSIPAQFRSGVGANVFGCDICQDVCPWNGRSWLSIVPGPLSEANTSASQRRKNVAQGVSPGEAGEKDRSAPLSHAAGEGPGVRAAPTTKMREFQPLQVSTECRTLSLFNPSLEALASITEDDFRRIFRHSPVRRVKYCGWLRNLCVAMGNSGDPRFAPWLRHAREHADPVVREHAEWALAQLNTL